MKLIGLLPVRNEDWILNLSARVALQWCDALVILLHACTDRSEEIALQLGKETGRVFVFGKDLPAWDEMYHRQCLLELARTREVGATHIALIDADEILTANLLPKKSGKYWDGEQPGVRALIHNLEPGQMLELPGYNLRGSLTRYHSNGIWGQRWFATAFKDCPEAHWQGNTFHHREPFGVNWKKFRPIQQGQGGVMHLWGASERRLKAKHALYKVTERLQHPEKPVIDIEIMYNLWRSERDAKLWMNRPEPTWEYAETPQPWWKPHWQISAYYPPDVHGEPWQEAEVRRLVAEHGRHTFAGLDLFGVA